MCKWCGTRYCKECLKGDFTGEMKEPTKCRVCNQVIQTLNFIKSNRNRNICILMDGNRIQSYIIYLNGYSNLISFTLIKRLFQPAMPFGNYVVFTDSMCQYLSCVYQRCHLLNGTACVCTICNYQSSYAMQGIKTQ